SRFCLPSPEVDRLSPLNMLTAGYPSAVVAQALALSGINFSLDAACASSLYAVRLACEYLLTGKSDLMLAGAISCTDPLMTHLAFSLFQAYPEDGNSCPLDQSSGGLMTGRRGGNVGPQTPPRCRARRRQNLRHDFGRGSVE
ncbi:MAG: hypothetical protein HC936_15900, partial [Leptolyngbyaceae cyanobacterium SU_3_3]|nr:hypothetical protein [Leptolyngbyaceae cyanobacterium SU_3_3]